MIGKLKGIVDAVAENLVSLDVNGVCYEAICSSRTLGALPRAGEPATLFVEMIVREDFIRLYGFSTEAEKGWFNLLSTVQGVGPRVAVAILSTLTASELSSAIALQDKTMVGRASGVGPKLAQRIVSELKGKLPDTGMIDAGTLGLQAAIGDKSAKSNIADAVSALSNLGYSSQQASAAIARVVAVEGDDAPAEKLIRLGLRELSA